MRRGRRESGLTLVELLVVLGILGVLLALFLGLNWRGAEISRAAYDLRALVAEARQEALRRNQSVWVRYSEEELEVCLDDATTCDERYRALYLSSYRGELSLEGTFENDCLRWRPEGFPTACDADTPKGGKLVLKAAGEAKRELCVSAGGAIRLENPGGCP